MSEQPKGTPQTDPRITGTPQTDPPANDSASQVTDPNQPFLHTYKTREEAEKGVREQLAEITRAQQENAALRKELEQAKALESLAASIRESNQPKPVSFESKLAKMREEAEERGVSEEAFDLQAELLLEQYLEIKGEINRELAEVRATLDRQAPEYLQHKDTVDKLVALGTPRNVALKLAADPDLIPKPELQTRPGILPPDTVIRTSGQPAKKLVTDELIAQLEAADGGRKITPEERRYLERQAEAAI